MEQNRLSSGVSVAEVEASIAAVITSLEEQIKSTEQLIKEHINAHSALTAHRDLLLSIPGIGEATTARLLAEIDFQQHESARSASRLYWLGAEAAAIRHISTRQGTALESRSTAHSSGTLLPGGHRDQM